MNTPTHRTISSVAIDHLQRFGRGMVLSRGMVYISGPMTNAPNYNRELFSAVGEELLALNFPVFNPAANFDKSWCSAMENDLARLSECQAMVLLTDWQTSTGARIEVFVARALELPIIDIEVGTIPYDLIDSMSRGKLEQLTVNLALRQCAIRRVVTRGLSA